MASFKDFQGKQGSPVPQPMSPQTPMQPQQGQAQPQPQQPYSNQWSLQGGFDLSGPGAAEQTYAQTAPQLQGPSYAEGFWGQGGGVQGAQSGTATTAYTQAYNPMAGQSRTDQFAGQYGGALGGPGATQTYQSDPNQWNQAQGATASGQYWNSLQGKSPVSQRDMSGFYDRAQQRGSAQIDKAAAARGNFNSSAAMDQQRMLSADLGAQQAKDEASYGLQVDELGNRIMSGAAGQSDQATQGRYGQGLQAAMGADSAQLGRFGAGASLAQAGDQTAIGRYNAGLTGASQADSSGVSRFGGNLAGALGADSGLNNRIGTLGQLGLGADNSRLGRTQGAFGALSGLTGDVSGTVGDAYGSALAADQGNFDMQQQLSLGAGLSQLGGVKDVSAMNLAAGNAVGQGATNATNNILALTKK